MKNRYIAPAAVLSLALTGCANQQDPESLGQENKDIHAITLQENANLRETPEFTNPDNHKKDLGILVTQLTEVHIDALRDLDDTELGPNLATVDTPNGVRTYEDRNGFWYGIDVKDITNDACSTDVEVNPFDNDAYDKVEAARLACDRIFQDLEGKDTIWINESRVETVQAND